jgi:hypothetical protein
VPAMKRLIRAYPVAMYSATSILDFSGLNAARGTAEPRLARAATTVGGAGSLAPLSSLVGAAGAAFRLHADHRAPAAEPDQRPGHLVRLGPDGRF